MTPKADGSKWPAVVKEGKRQKQNVTGKKKLKSEMSVIPDLFEIFFHAG